MANSTFLTRGNKNLNLVDIKTSWDSRNGGSTTLTYTTSTGTTPNVCPSDITTQAIELINNNWSCEITQTKTGGKWILVATYPFDLITDPLEQRIPDIQWDIEPYPVDQDLLECNDLNIVSNLSTDTKERIRKALQYPTGVIPLVSTSNPDNSAQGPNANIVKSLMSVGVKYREIFSVSIKRTLIVPKWYDPNWALVNNNLVLSWQFLVNNYAVPNWVSNQIPASSDIITDPSGLTSLFGYKETPPERHNLPGSKVQWTQHWIYNKWSVRPNGIYFYRL